MLIAVSAMHGRHGLSRVWAKHTAALGFDAVCVAVTKDDVENLDACVEHGFFAISTPNQPLSFKFNIALGSAMQHTSWDVPSRRFMILPSDDFASKAWVEVARNTTHDYIVPHTCGIYDLASGNAFAITKLSLVPGAVLKFGAGRVVSRRAVETCAGKLWPDEMNRGLDSASHSRLALHGIHHHVVETAGIPITDVKTKENIWGFNVWQPGSRPLSEDEALHALSPAHRAELMALRHDP